MSRAARRKNASLERRRRHWREGFTRFHRAAHGAIETFIVHIEDCLLLSIVALGDPTAEVLMSAMAQWADKATAKSDSETFLCLDCNQKFEPGITMPVAFAIAVPFADREHAIITGICRACAESGEDLQHKALRRWRTIWPDAHIIERGPGTMKRTPSLAQSTELPPVTDGPARKCRSRLKESADE